MIFKKMTASFGKLNNETLELHDGLNIITLPNEAGKSTWSEFLLAMLYGVDTSERRHAGGPVPIKERFQPWDGSPMQGTVELEHEGQSITLERTSAPRAPMSRFAAYYTDSGQPVTELDGKNCGAVLIGAERSVYERSGFLRQRSTGLRRDASLEQRLSSLVSTAEEDYSYSEINAALNNLKNRCRHNRTGLLPQTEQALSEVEQTLSSVDGYQKTISDLQQREQELLAVQKGLQDQLSAWQAVQAKKQRENYLTQRAAAAQATARREALESQCRSLPQKPTLSALSDAVLRLQERTQAAVTDAALLRREPPQAPVFPVFSGLTARQAEEKAEKDRQAAQALLTPKDAKKRSPLPPSAAILAAAVFAVLALVIPLPLLFVPAVLCALFVPVWLYLGSRERKKTALRTEENRARAMELLRPYQTDTPEHLPDIAAQYARKLTEYETAREKIRQQNDAAEAKLTALGEEKSRLLKRLADYFPDCDGLPAASRLLREGLEAHTALEDAVRSEQNALAALNLLRGLDADSEEPARTSVPDCPPADTREPLARNARALEVLRSELHRTQGLLDALGDRVELEARREQLLARKNTLSKKYDALTLAQDTLSAAYREVQSRFAPLLCGRAGELFYRLTGGAYDRLLLDQELNALCRQTGQSVTHGAELLSCGTADQAYLAVRLAICELLLGDAPLVLDDALLAFDDSRCRLALELLREEAKTRQILLFTCQSRESALGV